MSTERRDCLRAGRDASSPGSRYPSLARPAGRDHGAPVRVDFDALHGFIDCFRRPQVCRRLVECGAHRRLLRNRDQWAALQFSLFAPSRRVLGCAHRVIANRQVLCHECARAQSPMNTRGFRLIAAASVGFCALVLWYLSETPPRPVLPVRATNT